MGQRSRFKCSISTLGPTKARKIRLTKQQRLSMIKQRSRNCLIPAANRKDYKVLYGTYVPPKQKGVAGRRRVKAEQAGTTRRTLIAQLLKQVALIHG